MDGRFCTEGREGEEVEIVYLTPGELSERWKGRISVRTLSNWRSSGTGPKYTKTGGRILYPMHEIVNWECRRTTLSTSQYSK